MSKKNIVIIDGSNIIKKRGVGSYILSLISGINKIKVPPNINFFLIVPISYKFSKSLKPKNFKVLKRLYINKILWDFFLLPFYCWYENGSILHFTENTGGSNFSKLFKYKTVLTVHDTIFFKPFKIVGIPISIKQWLGLFYRRIFIKYMAKRANCIITVSECSKKDIRHKLDLPEKNIKVIHNSLPPVFFKKKNLIKNKKILLVSGESNLKNFNLTINCLESCQEFLCDWKILVVGIRRESTNFVKYIGQNINSIKPYYEQSSIFIMPSLYEGFSIPLIEALSCGLFVISSNRGAAPEILRNHGLLYNPTSSKELRESLIKAVKITQGRSRKYIKEGKKYALSFTNEKQANQTLEVYKDLLK
jgi:glycosyltransferase involved in cell wall biosynthesis